MYIPAVSGPVESPEGWVFAFLRSTTHCDDAPVAVHQWAPRAQEALAWAKNRFSGLFYPEATDNVFYLGIPSLADATQFKLMWIG